MVQRSCGRNEFDVCRKRGQCGLGVVGQGNRSDFFFLNTKARKTNGSLIMKDLAG